MHTYGNFKYTLSITCGEDDPVVKDFDQSVTQHPHVPKALTTCDAEVFAKNKIGESDRVSASILTKERGN